MRLVVAFLFSLAACGGGLPTAAPQDADTLLQVRTSGLTLSADESGSADLEGGPYRLAWVTDGCSYFQVAWVRDDGEATPIKTDAPSGELFIELPAGHGSLDRAADCDYTIRFERAP